MTTPLLFATSSYQYLATSLVAASGWQAGTIDRTTFPDGEHYYRLTSDPADRDVVLLGGTIDDQETLELYDLACGLVAGGAYRLTLVLPFYGYGTMERAVRPGEIVTAKNRARLLSSIPMASRGTQVFLLDLHVGAVTHYFEGGIRPVHVYGKEVVVAAARRLAASHGGDFVLACTDAGRAKWVESLANDLGVPAAFVYKRRIDGEHHRGHRGVGPGRRQAGHHLRRHDPHRRLAAERGAGLPRRRRGRHRRHRHPRPVPG
jgi:ribose-phosphate pyrophosphokinase